MIVYLFLAGHGYERVRSATVARGSGKTRFSETDDATRQLRGGLQEWLPVEARGPLPPEFASQSTEFLTARVPGTGLRVGLSPGLFRACQGLLETLQSTAEAVATERPEWAKYGSEGAITPRGFDLSEEAEAERVSQFKRAVDERTREQRAKLTADYQLGARQGTAVFDYPERENLSAGLEMYTSDTYVALEPDSVLMGPLRRE